MQTSRKVARSKDASSVWTTLTSHFRRSPNIQQRNENNECRASLREERCWGKRGEVEGGRASQSYHVRTWTAGRVKKKGGEERLYLLVDFCARAHANLNVRYLRVPAARRARLLSVRGRPFHRNHTQASHPASHCSFGLTKMQKFVCEASATAESPTMDPVHETDLDVTRSSSYSAHVHNHLAISGPLKESPRPFPSSPGSPQHCTIIPPCPRQFEM